MRPILLPAYPVSAPEVPITRWQGISSPIGLRPTAPPTARAAPGFPIRRATSPYEAVAPRGMVRTPLSTRWSQSLTPSVSKELTSPEQKVDEPEVGTRIHHYEVIRLLGRGGMGMVYRAEHVQLGRPVALKMLQPQLSHDPSIVQRFFNEARAVNLIGHENIVEVEAVAEAIRQAPQMSKDSLVIVNLSGRGDKDVTQVAAKIKL